MFLDNRQPIWNAAACCRIPNYDLLVGRRLC
jgi:hypothetical protein